MTSTTERNFYTTLDSDYSGKNTKLKITLNGMFADYNTRKNYQQQTPNDQTINLVMDKSQCKSYGDSNQDFAQTIDVHTKKNMSCWANVG